MVPLTTALRRLGAMGFGSMHCRAYAEAEVSFMQQVARQVAVAVDNALHVESIQAAQQQLARERDRVQLLLEVNNAVVSYLGLDDLFPAVSACLRKVIQHDGSALVLHRRADAPLPGPRAAVRQERVLHRGRPVCGRLLREIPLRAWRSARASRRCLASKTCRSWPRNRPSPSTCSTKGSRPSAPSRCCRTTASWAP